MIQTLILFILAYLLGIGLLNKERYGTTTETWFIRVWPNHSACYAAAAVIFALVFDAGNFFMLLLAAVISGCAHYIINIKLLPYIKENLTGYFFHQGIEIGIIYIVLLVFGLTGKPGWILEQL